MSKVCCVCEKSEASYKCPVCRNPYCSASCCKVHKADGCQPPEPQQNQQREEENKRKYEFPTEDSVPLTKLQELQNSDEIKECLKNPHVRNIMKAILRDSNPTSAIALAMTEPIFTELADACLKVVEPPENDRTSMTS
ncbi:hypothetical protein KM043_015079 [Ampulex compressa]|nr:hypothetical protein KM043_015079 [Ampulex compressa]